MPTAISNALGIAENSIQKPSAIQTSQLQGVQGGSFSVSTSGRNDAELANNLDKLGQVLGTYENTKEDYDDKRGLQQAKDMISGMSPDDIKKLNAVDAAQQYGYASAVSNPYFKAYAENLRGSYLSAAAKQEYDQRYAFTPAKSADDEKQRYAKFMDDWRIANLQGDGVPYNTSSFESGFNEANLVNQKTLADKWIQTDYNNKATTVVASTQAKLGSLIDNSVELLKSPGTMTNLAQQILNEPRLMGLPISERVKMVTQWSDEMVKTGHISGDRMQEMLNSLVISNDGQGDVVKASDVINTQAIKHDGNLYNAQFMTKEKYEWQQKWIDQRNYLGAVEDVQQRIQNDPEHAAEYNAMLPGIHSKIEELKNKEATARAAQAKKDLKAQQQDVALRSALKAHVNGNTLTEGQMADAVSGVPEELKNKAFVESIQYAMDPNNSPDMSPQTRMAYVGRILDFPPFNSYRESLVGKYSRSVRSIGVDDAGNPTYSSDIDTLINMRAADPKNFGAIFGNTLDGQVGTIQDLISNTGDKTEGLRQYAQYNSLTDDQRQAFKSSLSGPLSGYSIEGVHTLGGGITQDIPIYGTELEDRITESAMVQMANGADNVSSLNLAGKQMSDNYVAYHGTLVPRGAYNNIQTPDDEGYFNIALERNMSNLAQDAGVNMANVQVRYDDRTQTFYCRAGGTIRQYTLKRIHDGAYDIYAEDANSTGDNNTTLSVDDFNKQRGSSLWTPEVSQDPVNKIM